MHLDWGTRRGAISGDPRSALAAEYHRRLDMFRKWGHHVTTEDARDLAIVFAQEMWPYTDEKADDVRALMVECFVAGYEKAIEREA